MSLTRPSTLLLATAMASPALWQTFATHQVDLTTGLTRFLIAVPVSAVMIAFLRGLTSRYGSADPPPDAETPATPGTRAVQGDIVPAPARRAGDSGPPDP